jgi:hypothetical protein
MHLRENNSTFCCEYIVWNFYKKWKSLTRFLKSFISLPISKCSPLFDEAIIILMVVCLFSNSWNDHWSKCRYHSSTITFTFSFFPLYTINRTIWKNYDYLLKLQGFYDFILILLASNKFGTYFIYWLKIIIFVHKFNCIEFLCLIVILRCAWTT